MTSTSVKDASLGAGGLLPVSTKAVRSGGFQAVWNSRTERTPESGPKHEDAQTAKVRKTPGDSLKARDEHRARTEEREPIRDVEERADIPDGEMEEIPEEALEVLQAAAMELLVKVADILEVSPEQLQGHMEELGMEALDLLDSGKLGELLLSVKGAEDLSTLVTDEGLYDCFQKVMTELEGALQESGEILEKEPEQLPKLLEQIQDGTVLPETAELSEGMEQPEELSPEMEVADQRGEERAESQGTMEQLPEGTGTADRTSAQTRGDGRESRQSGGGERGQGADLFAQNLRTQEFEPQVQQAAVAESAWDADTQNIMRQILDYMKINLKPDASSLEMQLHPASLGTLQVQVASKGGVVTANFITQNEAVKAALETQMIQLKEQFAEQGVRVEAIEVTVQPHAFERNLDQGRGNDSQGREPAKKGRTRRIDLNASPQGEEPEQEELLAREILAANGNTVDYTV